MENFINRNQGNKEPGIITVDNQSTLLSVIDLLIGYGFSFPQDIKKTIQIVQKSQSICISEEQIKNDAANWSHHFSIGLSVFLSIYPITPLCLITI